MSEFDQKQEELLLQLKNMPKPTISKELAKEMGFDQKKYETIIENLLKQISEVRKERMRENYNFEQKIKSMNIFGDNKTNKKIVIKNDNNKKNSKNTKNLKININRPKSNYNSVKSSGYGINPKKIDIFSARNKKKININVNANKNKNLIPKSKADNNIPKPNNNIKINNNFQNKNYKKPEQMNSKEYNKNNINKIINNKNQNKSSPFNLNAFKNEINKIKNENKKIEEEYYKPKTKNNLIINKKDNLYKKNSELINQNINIISNNIINSLLYELIDDLKNIEEKKKKYENKNIELKNKINKKNKLIKVKFKAIPDKKLIENCIASKNHFYEYMKLKGSFLAKDIFKIYDEFIGEITEEIADKEINFCIKEMDNFIEKIGNEI